MKMPKRSLPRKEILASPQETADVLGIGRNKLHVMTQKGILTRLAHGKYDLKVVGPEMRRYEQQHHAAALEAEGKNAQQSFSDSRADLYRTRAEREGLELAQMRGEMLDANEVGKALRSGLTTMRQLLMGSGARLAPRLALITSPTRIQSMIDDENAYVLTQFATAPVIVDHVSNAERPDSEGLGSITAGDQAAAASDRKRVG
jgi:hypothetical protein